MNAAPIQGMGKDAVSGIDAGASERGSTEAVLRGLTADPDAGGRASAAIADAGSKGSPVIVHRCDRFVARTMNWLYDHLTAAPRYQHLIACDHLENRVEFPALEAIQVATRSRSRAVWRYLTGRDVNPLVGLRIKLRSPHALHSHFAYVATEDCGLQQSLGIPWVVSFYGADVYALGRVAEWRARYQQVFQSATRVLALGPAMATQIAQLGCPREKIQIHPLGVETSKLPVRSRHLVPGEPLRVLFAGTFREKKGITFALRAVAMAREEGVPIEFHLVAEAYSKPGDSETKDAALRLIGELGISGAVIQHPLLAFGALVDLALRCHVFVGPSVTAADGDAEGTPFVLQQMMATAMPVIATSHSDIPYIFGELGELLVPERDASAIAARLIEYSRKPDLLTEHGRLLRSRIAEAFDVHVCAARLCELYDALG